MSAKAICKIDLGVIDQTIYVQNEKYKGKQTLETYKSSLKELPEFFANLNDVNDIYLSGASKDFELTIEKETRKIQYKKYNQDTKIFHYI